MGKPVIYHNPHGERFPKYQEDPMGAFRITRTSNELIEAINEVKREILEGKDFRSGAKAYLQFHTNSLADHSPEFYAASAIQDILEKDEGRYRKRLDFFGTKPLPLTTSIPRADTSAKMPGPKRTKSGRIPRALTPLEDIWLTCFRIPGWGVRYVKARGNSLREFFKK